MGTTKSNIVSSRSHAIISFSLASTINGIVTNKQNLVICDLAGSERIKKTGATGEQLIEAQNINSSLSVLCNCIRQLGDEEKKVSWRDSKLTRLLKPSFTCQRPRIALLVCISPHSKDASESMSSIAFAQSAMKTKIRPKGEKGVIAAQTSLICELQQDIAKHEQTISRFKGEMQKYKQSKADLQNSNIKLNEDK